MKMCPDSVVRFRMHPTRIVRRGLGALFWAKVGPFLRKLKKVELS